MSSAGLGLDIMLPVPAEAPARSDLCRCSPCSTGSSEATPSGMQSPPTCYGQIEILEVLDLPGALTGCETLIKGFEEVGKGQLHVGDGRPPVLAVVRPHGSDEQALGEQREANESPRWEGRCTCPPKGIGPSMSSILTNSEGTTLTLN